MKNEISFLRHTFNEIKAEINIETRLAIKNCAQSKNKKQLQSFLYLINLDKRFVKNLARLTQPLQKLLKKNIKYVWTQVEQNAFHGDKKGI